MAAPSIFVYKASLLKCTFILKFIFYKFKEGGFAVYKPYYV